MRNKVSKLFLVALALVISVLIASCSQPSSADSRSTGADVIFTKWVTTAGTAPVVMNMAGVVSGDAGAGKFVGEVLEYSPTDTTTKITADYHINGGTHQFTAHLSVTQDNIKGTAVLKGVVTEGWMKGAAASGSYQVITPSGIINAQPPSVGGDVCYQGSLHIQ